jgi:transcriptional regulator with XRE-family HTH domain
MGIPAASGKGLPMTSDANPVDQYVGSRLREVRERLQLSPAVLATAAETTVEKIERYESGLERVGAERLRKFARALNVSPACFFKYSGRSASDRQERAPPQGRPIAGSNNVFDLRGSNEPNCSSDMQRERPRSKNEESN